jgi:hypothetical protein
MDNYHSESSPKDRGGSDTIVGLPRNRYACIVYYS